MDVAEEERAEPFFATSLSASILNASNADIPWCQHEVLGREMSSLSDHLRRLVSPVRDAAEGNTRLLEEWSKLPDGKAVGDVAEEPLSESEDFETVLDVYRNISSKSNSQSSAVQQLQKKPEFPNLLEPLISILSLDSNPDEISSELIELIGYEEVELATDILEHRFGVKAELEELAKGDHDDQLFIESVDPADLSATGAQRRLAKQLTENAARPLFSGTAEAAPEILPHVYTSQSAAQGTILSQYGSKFALPLGTTRTMYDVHEEVIIPPAREVPPKANERLIPVSELDHLAQGSFSNYKTLNRIQSIVFPTAYGSNENMLICAPTGAGKTDVAMLSILRVLEQHRSTSNLADIRTSIDRNSFKIIYVAPMKALASEIVRKLGSRLRWLSIEVRELTGDMQMTKAEIAQTQIIVTTPEKWDVVTRKPSGEGELATSLKLLIIDEVHLLNEERGAVIETIVARTLRQVESSQSVIRIVGLSATLPNYIDVADFLSVSRYKGLFYFDSSFRPIPLEQHFLGIKGKPGSPQSRKNLDTVTFQKVSDLVTHGHQVMVFVHARKETVRTAMALKEASLLEGNIDDFSCEDHPQYGTFKRRISESRNREMKQLFENGFGIHHAGMLRSDRNMMERMFEERAIKVLCTTATLAWGVNLPAHAVIIKGTQVYDSSKGAFVDLSVLDVLQIFGRAGRPGLETSGEGYICTTEDKLNHYLEAVTAQHPIESQFKGGMIDALNAEISLGTVANTHDAVQWLGYTYLFVRMRKNPFVYGLVREAVADDPQLGSQRHDLVTLAAQKLSDTNMIIFDRRNGTFAITDLGRIAAKYYIRYTSVEIFNKEFKPRMSEADVLVMLCKSTEFDQIQVRDSELKELEQLMAAVPCEVVKERETRPQDNQVDGSTDNKITLTSQDKVNILLQGYVSRLPVEDFALVSDTMYVAQNGGRIVRALLEIAISRKWAAVSTVLMGISKAVEKRLWPFDNPLKQFDLKYETMYALQQWADELSPVEIASQSPEELARLIHSNEKHANAILNAAKQFPSARITYRLRPLGFDLLKIAVTISKSFIWNSKVHGSLESFWIWTEDDNGLSILQHSHFVLRPSTEELHVDFVISIPNGQPPPFVTIRFMSDQWLCAEEEINVPLEALIMPYPSGSHSPLLDLPLLSTSIVRAPTIKGVLRNRVASFNAMQSQAFWSILSANCHSLLCAPSGSGKSLLAKIVAWQTALDSTWVLIITPRRSIAIESLAELRMLPHKNNVAVELSQDRNTLIPPKGKLIRVVTADHLLSLFSSRNSPDPISSLDLVICENLEQLNSPYELAVSLLRHATQSSTTRFVGFSSSLNDPSDLSKWLHVGHTALHSFRPTDREQSLVVSTQSFTIPQSASLFKVMAKPVHSAIQLSSRGEPVIVFIPSRGQCKTIALDLITQCALQMETTRGYISDDVPEILLESFLSRLRDRSLVDFVSRGVGFFHEGMDRHDRTLVLEMFAEGIVRVLLVPHDSCWTLPVRASVVVVMGNQYYLLEGGSERQLRDYSLPELVRMQSRAVLHGGHGQFFLFCQAEGRDNITRFINDGLPLESELLETEHLEKWYKEMRKAGEFFSREHLVDVLSFTFLAHRIVSNPSYYDCGMENLNEKLSRIADTIIDKATSDLIHA